MSRKIAVLIPCHNEEITIAKVVNGFKLHLPQAKIYVYDNASTDSTAEIAKSLGVYVGKEKKKGKGNVLRKMFADIDADIYIMIDGDDTYDIKYAPQMVQLLIEENLDMVVAKRSGEVAHRPGHMWGNAIFNRFFSFLFGRYCSDIFSGYRALSKRLVKTFASFSSGFEVETELTLHAVEMQMPIAEIVTPYYQRPPGSVSKLSTIADGFKILCKMITLLKEVRPFIFYTIITEILLLSSFAIDTLWIAAIAFLTGVILDSVAHGRREQKRLHYLHYKGIKHENCTNSKIRRKMEN